MRIIIALGLLFLSATVHAQELFSMTEPASNRPAHSIGVRIDNTMMDEIGTSRINYHFIPEVMIGISQKWMINAVGFFSNRSDVFKPEGGGLYTKYRFYSNDAMQKHFRMALFGRISFNNSDIHQEEIEMYGHNTGVELGIVATQLLRKVAISSGLSFVNATDNGNNNKFVYGSVARKAINYTLSAGKLILPTHYSNYKQTNINLMLEILSQVNTGTGKYYIDAAPSVQMILNSQARIDIGYRKQLTADLLRTAPNGIFIRVEYNFFNVF